MQQWWWAVIFHLLSLFQQRFSLKTINPNIFDNDQYYAQQYLINWSLLTYAIRLYHTVPLSGANRIYPKRTAFIFFVLLLILLCRLHWCCFLWFFFFWVSAVAVQLVLMLWPIPRICIRLIFEIENNRSAIIIAHTCAQSQRTKRNAQRTKRQ